MNLVEATLAFEGIILESLGTDFPGGAFTVVGGHKHFKVKKATCAWSKKHGLTYEYEAESGATACFKMAGKNAIDVAVDEDDEGNPVLERWKINQFKLTR